MSIDQRELQRLAGVARSYITLVDATTISMDDGGATGLTRDQLAVLLNRFYREFPGAGTPPTITES